jgi:hypothetical protein
MSIPSGLKNGIYIKNVEHGDMDKIIYLGSLCVCAVDFFMVGQNCCIAPRWTRLALHYLFAFDHRIISLHTRQLLLSIPILESLVHLSPIMSISSETAAPLALRKSKRLVSSPNMEPDESTHLILPEGCELVANTLIVFKWQDQCCLLQTNLTLYCWGVRRSGMIEHVLAKYGWTNSSHLHRVGSKLVSCQQWSWLKQVLVIVHRMFDEMETGDTVSKIHWLNIVDCRLAYELLRKECYHYHRNLYPAGSLLGIC